MSEAGWPSRERATEMIQRRLFFRNRPGTKLLVSVIILWYVFQLATLFLSWDKEMLQWVFTTGSFPVLSPGLFLATISHAFPPRLTHLFGNVALLWVFAGESERHMGRLEVVVFFVMTALVAVLAGTAASGGNTMGASGGVFAFIGFYSVHLVLDHHEELEFDTLGAKGLLDTSPRAYWGVAMAVTAVIMVPYLTGKLAGIVPVGSEDVVGHLTGFLFGVAYVMARRLAPCTTCSRNTAPVRRQGRHQHRTERDRPSE